MRYEIVKLDGRFTYRKLFGYCIKFSDNMARGQGPLHFNSVLEWFRDTYGWSAEIRQYDNIIKWVANSQLMMNQFSSVRLAQGISTDRPNHCNPHWSWTNGYDDLRIYVKSDAELNFFQLKWPTEQ